MPNEPTPPPPGWELVPAGIDDDFTDEELTTEDGKVRVRRIGTEDPPVTIEEAWRIHEAETAR